MDAAMFFNGEEDEGKQVLVRFVTKLPPPLKASNAALAIPSNLTRMGLSEIVNLLLHQNARGNEYQSQPFDFLIDGELIRMPLEEFLLAKHISAEKVLEIEYIKVVAPRKDEEPQLHDDWVSAVDGSNPSFVLTGCYDNLARVWKGGSSCTHILEGHNGAITSVHILKSKGNVSDNCFHLATGSKDRTLRLWKLYAREQHNNPVKLQAYKILDGHTSAVQSISSMPSGDKLCSGSWDCSIKLWDLNDADGGDSVLIKKRRTVAETNLHQESQLEGGASSTLIGHTQCVSSVVWAEDETIYSASWDHSIRRWDVQTGKETWNLFSGKVLHCVDVGGESSALVAAGASDPILRVWDPRKPGTLAPIYQFSSHSSWISVCKWHPSSWYHLLSASYDGKVMLWDIRTVWPVAVISSHTDKVLSADWWKNDSIISGGADSKFCTSSGISIP